MINNVEKINYIRLANNFVLPTPNDFDDIVEGIDRDIFEEGGPKAFMGMIRSQRVNWESMENGVLRPFARHSFMYEDASYQGRPPKTDLAISKAAFSGMLFGHILNEGAYPRVSYVRPYSTPITIISKFVPDRDEFEKLWDVNLPQAYLLGVQAMSSMVMNSLSTASLETINGWASVMVGSERGEHFNFGFGTALFLAWDAYSDMVLAAGDTEQVVSYLSDHFNQK